MKFILHRVKITGIILILLSTTASCSKQEDAQPIVVVDDQPNQYDVPFASVPGTTDIAMYEVNLGVFSPGGNLSGVKNKLDQLKELGINVIWLMPIYPIGELKGVGSPYSVKDYKQVNTA